MGPRFRVSSERLEKPGTRDELCNCPVKKTEIEGNDYDKKKKKH